MSKFKIVNIVDSVFLTFLVFIICFAWFQFYLREFFLSLFLALITSFAIVTVLRFFKNKKLTKKYAIVEKNKNIESYFNNFLLYSYQKQLSIIKSFIKFENVKTVGKHLEYVSNNKKTIVVTDFYINFDKTNLLSLIKTYYKKCNNLIIFTENINKECTSFAKSITNLKIKLLDKCDFYALCEQHNIKIEKQLDMKNEKIKLKNIAKNFFSTSHFKGFFVSGLIILFTSLIFPFTNYYLIFGTGLLIFSIICKLPKFKAINKDIFE